MKAMTAMTAITARAKLNLESRVAALMRVSEATGPNRSGWLLQAMTYGVPSEAMPALHNQLDALREANTPYRESLALGVAVSFRAREYLVGAPVGAGRPITFMTSAKNAEPTLWLYDFGTGAWNDQWTGDLP